MTRTPGRCSSQNPAYGSCLPGKEQDPAVWRVLRAGQEVFRTEGGDVYVLRNWRPDAPRPVCGVGYMEL